MTMIAVAENYAGDFIAMETGVLLVLNTCAAVSMNSTKYFVNHMIGLQNGKLRFTNHC